MTSYSPDDEFSLEWKVLDGEEVDRLTEDERDPEDPPHVNEKAFPLVQLFLDGAEVDVEIGAYSPMDAGTDPKESLDFMVALSDAKLTLIERFKSAHGFDPTVTAKDSAVLDTVAWFDTENGERVCLQCASAVPRTTFVPMSRQEVLAEQRDFNDTSVCVEHGGPLIDA
jgi:hypothetical protein